MRRLGGLAAGGFVLASRPELLASIEENIKGDESVDLYYFGAGHTNGDAFVVSNIASHGVGPSVYPTMPYDSVRDFSHVALMAEIRFFARHTGPAISPFNAWVQSESVEVGHSDVEEHQIGQHP